MPCPKTVDIAQSYCALLAVAAPSLKPRRSFKTVQEARASLRDMEVEVVAKNCDVAAHRAVESFLRAQLSYRSEAALMEQWGVQFDQDKPLCAQVVSRVLLG